MQLCLAWCKQYIISSAGCSSSASFSVPQPAQSGSMMLSVGHAADIRDEIPRPSGVATKPAMSKLETESLRQSMQEATCKVWRCNRLQDAFLSLLMSDSFSNSSDGGHPPALVLEQATFVMLYSRSIGASKAPVAPSAVVKRQCTDAASSAAQDVAPRAVV